MHREDLAIARSMLKKLIYFDIFSHPLLPNELVAYSNYPNLSVGDGMRILSELRIKKLVNYHAGFYFLGNDVSKIERRLEGNQLATLRLKTARKYAALVSNFPFVRAVFISGSLSKHVMKPDSDVDFFIITEPGKLWLCRGILTLFKKVFLGNSYRNFCLNYFIDTENLEIPDKNIFTATEVAFLLPMYNEDLYKEFMIANQWCREEYPNFADREQSYQIKPHRFRKIPEYILNNRIGDWFDQKCFSIITGYWKNKFHNLSSESFSLNFRSQKNVSKHHPNAFQEKVVSKFNEKIRAFEESSGFTLDYKQKGAVVKQ